MTENDILIHYGVLGMKWGVRRTPEELGHKKITKARDKAQKYKDNKIKKIEKMYAKAISETTEMLEYDPENKKLKTQLDGLIKLKQRDIGKVNEMTYTDVVQEQKAISQQRKQKAMKAASTTVRAAGDVMLWGAKMGLVGVRIYGTFKAAQIVGEMGGRAIQWLNSPEGQQFVQKGMKTANTFLNFGDKIATVANPELGKYLDSKYLTDMAADAGKQYVNSTFGNEINQISSTINSVTNTVDRASNTLDQLDKRIRSAGR